MYKRKYVGIIKEYYKEPVFQKKNRGITLVLYILVLILSMYFIKSPYTNG